MTFSVKQYVADKQLEPFVFEDINGDRQELPNLLTMTASEYDAFSARLDVDPVAAMSSLAPNLVEVIQATPLVALQPLIDAYMAHMKPSPGESPASPGPSVTTARPSKRTSRASTTAKTRKR